MLNNFRKGNFYIVYFNNFIFILLIFSLYKVWEFKFNNNLNKKIFIYIRVKMLIKRMCKSSCVLIKFVFIWFLKFKINVNKY